SHRQQMHMFHTQQMQYNRDKMFYSNLQSTAPHNISINSSQIPHKPLYENVQTATEDDEYESFDNNSISDNMHHDTCSEDYLNELYGYDGGDYHSAEQVSPEVESLY